MEDDWSWEYDTCDMQGCTEPAPYRLYVSNEHVQNFCQDHMQQAASEHAWLWRDVADVVAAAELPLDDDEAAADETYRRLEADRLIRAAFDTD